VLCVLSDIRSGLRSTSSSNFAPPQLPSKFGERSFSHAGSSVERSAFRHSCRRGHEMMKAFRQAVKIHYFSLAFSVY